jgi:hypothetical protein
MLLFKRTIAPTLLLTLLAGLLAGCASQPAATGTALPAPTANASQTPETFVDPFAYCAAVGTVDSPDARYTGAAVPDAIIAGYKKAAGLEASTEPAEMFRKTTIWRCMAGTLYACNFGANLPCDSRADTNKTPSPAISDYCQANPDAEFIPMSVTGHTTVYSWHCSQSTPGVADQLTQVDAAGYLADIWYPLAPGSNP